MPDPSVDPVPVPQPPTLIPPLAMYLIAVVGAVVSLFVTQGLIDNHIEKLVSGLAAIGIPAVWVFANAIHHLAVARVKAADTIARGQLSAARLTASSPAATATHRRA